MLSFLFPAAAESRVSSLENPAIPLSDPDAWREAFGASFSNYAGEPVSHHRALTLSPVWRALMMIPGDVSKLPLEVLVRDGKNKEADTAHHAYDRLHFLGKANVEMTGLQLWRRYMESALLFNQAYAWLDWANNNTLLGIYPLLPDRTTWMRKNGRKWVVTEVNGHLEVFPYEEVLHITGPNPFNLTAPDLVVQAREDFAQALAARGFTSKFFKNGCHAGGVLEVPPGTTPKAKKKVESGIQNRSGLDNAFRSMILRDGFKWIQTMVDPSKAQLPAINDQKVRDVANWFNMSPARLGLKESISYNSLEQERKDYFDTTLSYWLTAIKSECNTKILTEDDRKRRKRVIDYNINALLWADASTVAVIGFGGVDRGVLTADEVRGWWNLNAFPNGAGATPRVPLNTAPAAQPDDNADRSTRLQASVRTLLADAIGRCVTRWSIHAERSTKTQELRDAWLSAGIREHDEICGKILRPAIEAARACGILPINVEPLPALREGFVASLRAGQSVDANHLLKILESSSDTSA